MNNKRSFNALKKRIEFNFDPKLNMELCGESNQTHTHSIPVGIITRLYVMLNKEIIWEFPKDFGVRNEHFKGVALKNPIGTIIIEYLETPPENITKLRSIDRFTIQDKLINENRGSYEIQLKLIELFIAADKRLGVRVLRKWEKEIYNRTVNRIIGLRFGK